MKKNFVFLVILFGCFSITHAQMRFLEAGDVAPQLKITDYLKNKPADTSYTGKLIVLDFWATWCAPCLAGIPKMNAIMEKFKSRKDIVFIAMTYESPKITKPTLDRIDFQMVVATDRSHETFKNYGMEYEGNIAVPLLVLIDKSGKIYYSNDEPDNLQGLLEDFINGRPYVPVPIAVAENGLEHTSGTARFTELLARMSEGSEFLFEVFPEKGQLGIPMEMNYLEQGRLSYIQIKLSEIFSNAYPLSALKLVLPESLRDQNFSVLYRNPERLNFEEHRELLRKLLIAHFKLKEVSKITSTEVYVLRLIDPSKLVLAASTNSDSSTNETHLLVNGPLSYVISAIQKWDIITIIDETGLVGKYDFLLKKGGGPSVLIKELESYGLTLTKDQRAIKTIFLEQL